MTTPVMVTKGGGCGGGGSGKKRRAKNSEEEQQQNQISVAALLLAVLRKSMVSCRVDGEDEAMHSAVNNMEIGWPTNVRHVSHVTFDRFNGFLGLPLEFQVEVPGRVPSEDGVEAFGEIEECFLRQPDDENNKDATYSFLEKPSDEPHTSTPPGSWTGCNLESSISFTDSKNENSGSTTSDGEDNDGVDVMDKLVESTTLNVI
ncbi:hypothetical protein GOBAR_DD25645 [Gossypium barbadense]|nr:hypothetical protein GOBAR_DD25645 [Gossypium barbadense]